MLPQTRGLWRRTLARSVAAGTAPAEKPFAFEVVAANADDPRYDILEVE